MQALFESGGEIFLAEPMDNPGRNITKTADRLEMFPQWWPANPSRVLFNVVGVKEREQMGWRQDLIGHTALMNKDGSGLQQLTRFNTLGYPESNALWRSSVAANGAWLTITGTRSTSWLQSARLIILF